MLGALIFLFILAGLNSGLAAVALRHNKKFDRTHNGRINR
jgi:hypothetical protein